MDQRIQLEQNLFFNIVEPEWRGHPQLGHVHFRKRSFLTKIIADRCEEPFDQNLFCSIAHPEQQGATLEGRELFNKVFRQIGYPCHLIEK